MSLMAIALAAAATQGPALQPICGRPKPTQVDVSEKAKLKRLDTLPPAEAYLTVLRTEGGCIHPVKVSEERARRR